MVAVPHAMCLLRVACSLQIWHDDGMHCLQHHKAGCCIFATRGEAGSTEKLKPTIVAIAIKQRKITQSH